MFNPEWKGGPHVFYFLVILVPSGSERSVVFSVTKFSVFLSMTAKTENVHAD